MYPLSISLVSSTGRAACFSQYPCSTKSGPVASGDDCDQECLMSLDRHDTRARLLSFEGRQAKTAPAAFPQPIHRYSLEKQTSPALRFAALRVVQKNRWSQLLRSCKHSKFLRQLQQSCSVPRLRTRVPQRRHYVADSPAKLSHDDARRPPHVQRDEAAHASRSA